MCIPGIFPAIGGLFSAAGGASTVLPIATGIVSGVTGLLGAAQTAAGYEADAQVQARQAQLTEMSGAYEAEQAKRQVARVLGSQRAGFAASGVSLEGSALDVIGESATEGALDVAAIKWGARSQADVHRFQSKQSQSNARSARASGPLAFLAPVLSSAARIENPFASR